MVWRLKSYDRQQVAANINLYQTLDKNAHGFRWALTPLSSPDPFDSPFVSPSCLHTIHFHLLVVRRPSCRYMSRAKVSTRSHPRVFCKLCSRKVQHNFITSVFRGRIRGREGTRGVRMSYRGGARQEQRRKRGKRVGGKFVLAWAYMGYVKYIRVWGWLAIIYWSGEIYATRTAYETWSGL